jgi:hypothetical protein
MMKRSQSLCLFGVSLGTFNIALWKLQPSEPGCSLPNTYISVRVIQVQQGSYIRYIEALRKNVDDKRVTQYNRLAVKRLSTT